MATSTNSEKKLKEKSDFIFLRTIGEGSFSTVHLAEEKKTGLKFAIKECDKHQILKEKKVKYIHLEKRILTQYLINHPFIIKLCFTFQDESSLYFGLIYCSNGDLLEFIKKHSVDFKTKAFSPYYSAQIVDAVEFMHSKNIIHRDLKPENIILDERRFIKVSDFGTARILDDPEETQEAASAQKPTTSFASNEESPENSTMQRRRNSFVGTAQYVSPEVLQGKEPHKGCDLWALGCIIFQMYTGKHCFTGNHEYDIFQKVVKGTYKMHEDIPDKAKQLIQKLIVVDPSQRLGVEEQGGFQKLKENEFFSEINWQTLSEQDAPEPSVTNENLTIELKLSKQLTLDNNKLVPSSFSSSFLSVQNSNKLFNVELFLDLLKGKNRRDELLKQQSIENVYHKFTNNSLILKQGFLLKKKDMRSRKRMFLLTDGPNLFYVDSENMTLKGSIPWCHELKCETKNFQIFYVHTPNRKYHLIDEQSCALEWSQFIMRVKSYYFKEHRLN